MKHYENPQMNVIAVACNDVVTSSVQKLTKETYGDNSYGIEVTW